MSIWRKMLLSNIGMIVIPIIFIFILDAVLGYVLFVVLEGNTQGKDLNLFLSLHIIGLFVILIVTNGLLTYFVSKNIIRPIKQLSNAAEEISNNNLDFSVASNRKDELGDLSNAFDKMRLDLKEAKAEQLRYEKDRKELVASISHDLKTPLTSIKGYVKGIQDGVANTPTKLERYLDTIHHKANDMDVLIDELFLYSKLDLERIPFTFEAIDLYPFFTDFMDELSVQMEKEGGSANLVVDTGESFIVHADREQLKRVVTNIIDNSLKYIDTTPQRLEVYLKSDMEKVIVTIKDNGVGITKEDLPYVFNSFYRTDSSRNSKTGGSGLGLSIVKKIIVEHGGTVNVESELGKGTSIYFTLKKV